MNGLFGTVAGQHVLLGVVLSALAFGYFYLCGSVIRAPRLAPDWEPNRFDPSDALLDIVLTTTSGIAIVGFATFLVGLAGLIYVPTLFVLPIVLGVVAAALGDSPLRPSFWKRRWAVWRRAVRPGAALVVLGAIVLAVPAILPDTGSDATLYHHAYAFDWADKHRLYTDVWLRAPFYANNWLLIVTWIYELHGIEYVQFLNWFTGLLSMLCVYAFVARAAPKGGSAAGVRATFVALAAVTMLAAAPTFLHLVVLSYIDVPMGLFFLAFAATAVLAVVQGRRFALVDAVLIGAFFVGMKISLIAFLPLVVVVVLTATLRMGLRRRAAAGWALASAALALPWYVRNFILDGDPVPPILNLAVRGKDAAFSKADYSNGVGAIAVDKSLGALMHLPWKAFTAPATLQDVGLSMVILLLWLPAFVVAYAAVKRRWPTTWEPGFVAALLLFAYAYWTQTSYFIRYAVLFFPLLCAFVGALAASRLNGRFANVLAAAATAVLLVLAIPPASSAAFLQYVWSSEYVLIGATFQDRESWLAGHSPGYREVAYAGTVFAGGRGDGRRLYRLNLETLTLFFKLHGVDSIGEWWGPERYKDFRNAVDRDEVAAYIRRFNLGAFMLPLPGQGTILTQDEFDQFRDEMRALGFRRVQLKDSPYTLFFAPQLAPLPPLPVPGTIQ